MKILVSQNTGLTDYDVDLTETDNKAANFSLPFYGKISYCSIKDK